MYGKHSYLKRPANSLQPLWRYFKYERLIDLLSTETLFFCRLSRMSDRWEGLLSDRTRESLLKNQYNQYHDANIAREAVQNYENHRDDFCINCWHMNEAESYLMWKVYGDKGESSGSFFGNIVCRIRRSKLIPRASKSKWTINVSSSGLL